MKKVLITGSTGAIGEACAKYFHDEGYFVYLHYRNNTEKANKLQSSLQNSKTIQFDITDKKSVRSALENIEVEILVNNAGITKDKLAMRMKVDEFMAVIDANLKSSFIGSREALKVMSKKRFGSVVNVASIVGESGNVGQTNYSASKGGMIAMTKSFAQEGASRGIRFNTVTPGFIATEMTEVLKPEIKEGFIAKVPLGRFGEPREVAEAIAFLLSDHASYITGETLKINGGMLM